MRIKTYKAVGVISFPVTLKNGSYRRIKFLPYSYGGSIFTTSDKDIQDALENSKGFGSSFVLVTPEVEEEQTCTDAVVEKKNVNVSDIDDAKDYLVDNHGYRRSSLRSVASIKSAAETCGIAFIGI